MSNTIWTYWHQGIEEAPKVIHHCIKSMKAHHPGWQIHILDKHSVSDFIDEPDIRSEVLNNMSLAHRSDLIRTKLLIKYGGVWADPTCFFNQNMDKWLTDYMDAGIFFFCKPGRDRIISNWFIAAESTHPFLIQLYEELCNYWDYHDFRNLGRKEKSKTEYWLNRIINRNLDWPRIWFHPLMTELFRIYPYLVYHYKFYDILKNNEKYEMIWNKMDKMSANQPAKLKRYGLLKPINEELRLFIDEKICPLHKLTWKLNSNEIPEESIMNYLISTIK